MNNLFINSQDNKNNSMPFDYLNNSFKEEILQWGHYKPHMIYSVSEKKNNPISINMG